MPNPLKKLQEGSGLWLRCDLPSAVVIKILEHLAGPGEPRLYVQSDRNGYVVQAGISNTAHVAGWSVDPYYVHTLVGGSARPVKKPWMKLDKKTTRTGTRSIKVYEITKGGHEVIAQYRAHERYKKETIDLARKILAEERAAASALKK